MPDAQDKQQFRKGKAPGLHFKHSDKQVLDAIKDSGGIIVTICARLGGCSRGTFYSYLKKRSVIADAYKEETENILDDIEGALIGRARDGEPWAVCFYLKTKGKARGYQEKAPEIKEPTGPTGVLVVPGTALVKDWFQMAQKCIAKTERHE